MIEDLMKERHLLTARIKDCNNEIDRINGLIIETVRSEMLRVEKFPYKWTPKMQVGPWIPDSNHITIEILDAQNHIVDFLKVSFEDYDRGVINLTNCGNLYPRDV
jgi:hypothetical protein